MVYLTQPWPTLHKLSLRSAKEPINNRVDSGNLIGFG